MTSNIKHIIIADDDNDDIEMFQDVVDEICPNLKLTVAPDGEILMTLLNSIPKPDAIVLDLNMPFKGGKECLHEIRTQIKFNDVPIVILSTSNHEEDIIYCLTNGANHYYVKPSTYYEYKSMVENFCSGRLTGKRMKI
ncbi:MAG: response regulator receiver protein [Segetibacter sp.]|nr:response regulator receiver protein [Segetibacter sp.]